MIDKENWSDIQKNVVDVSNKIKKGTHLISTFSIKEHEKHGFELISTPKILYSWMVGKEIKSYLYIKI